MKQWTLVMLIALLLGVPVLADKEGKPMEDPKGLQVATLAGGCFWCMEALYQRLDGVVHVVSGFSGGTVPNPSYELVCTGNTGHAEAVQITFDPKRISYRDLLQVFWQMHDPTTLNRQGNDAGTQYRSAIFYHDEEQHRLAEETKKQAQALYPNPIVTEIVPYRNFYSAEAYHQDYYNQHTSQGYCRVVIEPKIEKFRQLFHDRLKAAAR
ncbi:MAG TPA: peptide-methionine (S)-S-oxide reductase MsrA [Candidatus Xenobia bacterium]|jgi:peptide-methionine (S)-S-oxide reductase